MKEKFRIELPLVMPEGLKAVWVDSKGRQYILERLSQATFSVQSKDSGEVIAAKQDPVRTYYFTLNPGTVTFTMELDTRLTNNPHRYLFDTLFGELSMLQSWAREFTTEKISQANLKKGDYSYVS